VCNAKAIQDPVKNTIEAPPTMSVVYFGEPEQRGLAFPLPWIVFFNPVPGDSEISVCIIGLPSIKCGVDSSTNGVAL
jgi:hypothetical protein